MNSLGGSTQITATVDHHIGQLAHLKSDTQRKLYLDRAPDLCSDEGARLLCRSAVALLYSDVTQSRNLCRVLTYAARRRPTALTRAYCDHAWGAIHFNGGNDYRKALTRWRRAVVRFEKAGRHDEAAITRLCALPTLVVLEQLDLFSEWMKRAQQVFENNGDKIRLARLRLNAANLHFRRSEWALAAEAYEEAYKEFISAGADSRNLFVAIANLAVCHAYLGDLPRAASLTEKARRVCEDANLGSSLAHLDELLAYVNYLRGDLAAALKCVRRMRHYTVSNELRHSSSENAHTEAQIMLALGVHREAERCATEALEGFTALGLATDGARALTILALCAARRGRHEAALRLHTEARRIFEGATNIADARHAALEQATCLFMRGNLQSANSVLRELLASFEPPSSSPVELGARLLLSKILLEQGELKEALRLAEAVLARVSIQDRAPMEAEALHLFARLHELLGNHRVAFDSYLRCERCIARQRRQLAPANLRTHFLSDKQSLYEDIFCLAARLGTTAARLFEHAESAKSRTLADLLIQETSPPWNSANSRQSEPLANAWASLRACLKEVEALSAPMAPRPSLAIEELQVRISEAEHATFKAMAYQGLRGGADHLVVVDELVSALPPQTGLVEYYFARGMIFVFYVSSRGCSILPVGEVGKALRLQRLLHLHLRRRPNVAYKRPSSLLEHLGALYRLLWYPLEQLAHDDNLIVVPHGFLHQLPFHALWDGQQFLVDRHAISYSPSAEVLRTTRRRARDKPRTGSVVIGSSDSMAPFISSEASEIGEMLPDAEVFVSGQASRAYILNKLSHASLIHIAAHAAFSPSDPSASAVGLDDGPLTVNELQQMRLQADLVVLSGCGTGKNVTRGSDEVLGMTQALLQAGARSALVSLWSVDDESTADFMRLFYSNLQLIGDRAECLRSTQRTHRQTHDHPFYWAPFVLVGDPHSTDPLPSKSSRPNA